jgi:RNA polymerase sigma factor (sigma-70 family)
MPAGDPTVVHDAQAAQQEERGRSRRFPAVRVVVTDLRDQAFADRCRAVHPRLLAYVRRQGPTRSYEDADDVCQDVWLDVCRRTAAGTEIHSLAGFARKIAHDRVIDGRNDARAVELVDLSELEEQLGFDPELDAAAGAREGFRDQLETLVDSLGPTGGKIVVLRALGLSRAEVAERLGVSERHVKRTLEDCEGKAAAGRATLRARGRCAMLPLALEDLAAGRLAPQSDRWASVHRHLVRCTTCRTTLRAMKHGGAAGLADGEPASLSPVVRVGAPADNRGAADKSRGHEHAESGLSERGGAGVRPDDLTGLMSNDRDVTDLASSGQHPALAGCCGGLAAEAGS